MATYYMEISPGVTGREVQGKFEAFETLYGKARILFQGDLPIMGEGSFPGVRMFQHGSVVKVEEERLVVQSDFSEEEITITFRLLERTQVLQPLELMFVTVEGV